MRHLVDLHTHSTASDGTASPEAVVALAEQRRLAAVALTDHDTTDGLAAAAAAAAAYDELTFIPGVELSAVSQGTSYHMLGLHIDADAPALTAILRRLRDARRRRNDETIAVLRGVGIDITPDDLPGRGRVVGRPHIARALVSKGVARDEADAFDRYLLPGRPAYIKRDRPRPGETIDAIHGAGGVAVLAHPIHLGYANAAQCERIVRSLIGRGLDGVEAYHSDQCPAQTRLLIDLARRLKLVVTGGSDFHGPSYGDFTLGRPRVPKTVLEPLAKRAAAICSHAGR
ncbi:MAG: PHP domain-containing protein [Planctomycetota bacterium]